MNLDPFAQSNRLFAAAELLLAERECSARTDGGGKVEAAKVERGVRPFTLVELTEAHALLIRLGFLERGKVRPR
ncbi:MAG TPA: hypothetical protein VF777_13390 [Phycisphaerales bacterium]